MAIGKRTRFEILKRDGFKCKYCGATPAAGVVLHIDHVEAVANGGSDDPANLVVACKDCNLGKSAVPLEQRKFKHQLAGEEEKEHLEQLKAYLAYQKELHATKQDIEATVLAHWQERVGDNLPRSLPGILANATKEFGVERVIDAIDVVARKGLYSTTQEVKYFCGIVRKWRNPEKKPSADEAALAQQQEATLRIASMMLVHYCQHRYQWDWSDTLQAAFSNALRKQASTKQCYRVVDQLEQHYLEGSDTKLCQQLEALARDPENWEDDGKDYALFTSDEFDAQRASEAADAIEAYWWHRHGKHGPKGIAEFIHHELPGMHPNRFHAIDIIEDQSPDASDEEKLRLLKHIVTEFRGL